MAQVPTIEVVGPPGRIRVNKSEVDTYLLNGFRLADEADEVEESEEESEIEEVEEEDVEDED